MGIGVETLARINSHRRLPSTHVLVRTGPWHACCRVGTGGFSVVKRVTDRETGENLACKIMTLPPDGGVAADGESTRTDIFKEIDIIMTLRTCIWLTSFVIFDICSLMRRLWRVLVGVFLSAWGGTAWGGMACVACSLCCS